MAALHLTRRQLADAAQAWQSGGSLGLGHWAARQGLGRAYGELVMLVRVELGDDTDYSQEEGHDATHTDRAAAAQP